MCNKPFEDFCGDPGRDLRDRDFLEYMNKESCKYHCEDLCRSGLSIPLRKTSRKFMENYSESPPSEYISGYLCENLIQERYEDFWNRM